MAKTYMKKLRWVILLLLLGLVIVIVLAVAYEPVPREFNGIFI